jgi:two-component system, cell cycle response regulator DivK
MDLYHLFDQFQTGAKKKPCVLALETDEDNLLLIGYIVQQLNCNLLIATEGLQALSLAQEYQPDIILLEPDLPGMNSYELIHKLKSSEVTSHIPLIALTRRVLPQEKKAILEAGCDACLGKPYLIDALENLLHIYLPNVCVVPQIHSLTQGSSV